MLHYRLRCRKRKGQPQVNSQWSPNRWQWLAYCKYFIGIFAFLLSLWTLLDKKVFTGRPSCGHFEIKLNFHLKRSSAILIYILYKLYISIYLQKIPFDVLIEFTFVVALCHVIVIDTVSVCFFSLIKIDG